MILSKIKVVAAGSNRTRFINKLKDENIAIYDLVSEDKSVFWIKHNDFKVVKKFADVYSIQLEIKDNGGLLKILHNTYKHLPYMIAATICLIFLFASTAFVYNIQVDAQNDIYANKVHTFLKENNYGGIVAKNKIDLKAIENLITFFIIIFIQRKRSFWLFCRRSMNYGSAGCDRFGRSMKG